VVPLTLDDFRAPPDEAWVALALCRGAGALFYAPPWGESATARTRREGAAKDVCRRCPVQSECLRYSLRVHEPLGVWGGLAERERHARVLP